MQRSRGELWPISKRGVKLAENICALGLEGRRLAMGRASCHWKQGRKYKTDGNHQLCFSRLRVCIFLAPYQQRESEELSSNSSKL